MSKVKKIAMRATVRNIRRISRTARDASTERFEVRELDPLRKCGEGTTVKSLFRLLERREGVIVNHLVYFDRHGWYCEHGRECAAVAVAQRHGSKVASGVNVRSAMTRR